MARNNRAATYGRMVAALRVAERSSGTGGTGATIVKLSLSPIAQLTHDKKPVDGQRFGSHEFQAAQEIETAFFAISGGLLLKPLLMEKIDRGHGTPDWPADLAKKVWRYQAWAGHWSMMKAQCDHTLRAVIEAVIDERPIRQIADDMGFHHDRIRNAIVRGLRDYAARAGWVGGRDAAAWKLKAGQSFRRN